MNGDENRYGRPDQRLESQRKAEEQKGESQMNHEPQFREFDTAGLTLRESFDPWKLEEQFPDETLIGIVRDRECLNGPVVRVQVYGPASYPIIGVFKKKA